MKLIALVNVAVMVKGERLTIAPGEEVTGLSAVDVAELKACGAVEDLLETAELEKKQEAAEKKTAREFADARKAVQARQAAIEAPAA